MTVISVIKRLSLLWLCCFLYPNLLQAQEAEQFPAKFLDSPLIFRTFRGTGPTAPKFNVELPASLDSMRRVLEPESPAPSFENRTLSEISVLDQLRYDYMLTHPDRIKYLAWTLPLPPELTGSPDLTKEYVITDMPIAIDDGPNPVMLNDIKHINWLHKFDGGLQFSQAYLSPNWYQGGNNNLTLLVNLSWDVNLNEVYHPNLLFTNSFSYKLGLYSTPQDTYHKYGISQDLFQWNMKAGVRASSKWFYSFTAQFKTQFINNYGENSQQRKAAFMSPGELNLGLGMTYAIQNKKGNFKMNTSIAPISYNLKTCIDRFVDPTQFSIPAGKRFYNQIGSNAELAAEWNVTSNIKWKSRIFIFTDYQTFQADWEHTINFSINRFLSTQVYLNMRYDTSSTNTNNGWRYWMIKEILSFGFQYAFSTK